MRAGCKSTPKKGCFIKPAVRNTVPALSAFICLNAFWLWQAVTAVPLPFFTSCLWPAPHREVPFLNDSIGCTLPPSINGMAVMVESSINGHTVFSWHIIQNPESCFLSVLLHKRHKFFVFFPHSLVFLFRRKSDSLNKIVHSVLTMREQKNANNCREKRKNKAPHKYHFSSRSAAFDFDHMMFVRRWSCHGMTRLNFHFFSWVIQGLPVCVVLKTEV